MVEGARLESVYTFIAYQGFESLLLRQTSIKSLIRQWLFYCLVLGGPHGWSIILPRRLECVIQRTYIRIGMGSIIFDL